MMDKVKAFGCEVIGNNIYAGPLRKDGSLAEIWLSEDMTDFTDDAVKERYWRVQEINQGLIALAEKRQTVRADKAPSSVDGGGEKGEVSDGCHTFNELYEHRHTLFIALLKCYSDKAWKSRKHADGSMFDGWFIAGIETPEGHATYHMPERFWHNLVRIEAKAFAPEWDGHTSKDVLKRISSLTRSQDNPAQDATAVGKASSNTCEGYTASCQCKSGSGDQDNAPVVGWLPIETVPKDGSCFLVKIKNREWDSDPGSYSVCTLDAEYGLINHEVAKVQATHWMPLPAAPEKGGG